MSQHPAPKSTSFRLIAATTVGNALEWFDWQMYATFAPYIAAQLFDPGDPIASLLQTFAVFAVGFLARPLGGFFFGRLADQRGRKLSLILAIIAASFGSLLIAVIPSSQTIGVWAAVLLLIARLVQGAAHGGEMPAAQTYLSETAPAERRGLWSSLIYISGTSGLLLATLLGAALTGMTNPTFMNEVGWRIPFVVGAVLGLFVLVMRIGLHETSTFTEHQQLAHSETRPKPLMSAPKAALLVILATVGGTVAFYSWTISSSAFAATSLGMEHTAAFLGSAAGQVVFILAQPVWGALSDRIGRRPVLAISMFGTAAAFFPMRNLMSSEPWTLIVSLSVVLVFLAGSTAVLPAIFSELFPTHIRTVGTAVPYSIAVALFGGTSPYLQTWFTDQLHQAWMFSAYSMLLLVISGLTAIFLLPETKGRKL